MKPSKSKGILACALCALCALCAAVALAGCAQASSSAPSGSTGITVSASSETKVVPDKARVNIAVVSEEKAAEDCRSANARAVEAVLSVLSQLGVKDESVQTTYADLSPRYGTRVSDGGKDEDGVEDWVISGYEMTTQLAVSDLEIDAVGDVVQKCVAAGANRTDGIQYYASNYDEAYNEALAQALVVSKAKADNIASAIGAKLGKVVRVDEGYQDTSARYDSAYGVELESADDADAGVAAKTMPGQIDITANVTVTYEIS